VFLNRKKAMLTSSHALTQTAEKDWSDASPSSCLLVDDDELLLDLMAALFRRHGFRVLTAPTGEMALRLARRHQPGFILLDLGLPGRDGLQVLRTMRRCDKLMSTPIVVLTGREVLTDLFDAYNLGADDYLVKPVHSDELVSRVGELLRERH
jgi:DNA-binding response OmpR family regulator